MFAPPLDAPASTRSRGRRTGARAGRRFALAASLAFALGSAPAVLAQDAARPDQVFRLRKGKVTKVVGTVTENSLETVRLDRDGKEATYDAGEVVRVIWGQVPPAFTDGQAFLSRGDFENAVARFRVAASDASGREVVQAAARLHAAEALLAWGATDPNRSAEAVSEADRFLADHPSNRDVPNARWIKGRSQWLSGQASAAAMTFKALYEQGASDPPAPGYDHTLCLDAGLAAAKTFLESKDTRSARELFVALEESYRQAAQDVEEDPELLARLLAGQGEASVGGGWCDLVGGSADQAIRFFEARVDRAELGAAGRFSARLGLAEAHLAKGQAREAQLEFARVSALDHASRDRVAQALVGLADAALRLGDSDAKASARKWLESVRDDYGDTPAAPRAATLLASLN